MWKLVRVFGWPGAVMSGVLLVAGLFLNWQDLQALGWTGSTWAFIAGTVFVVCLLAIHAEQRYGQSPEPLAPQGRSAEGRPTGLNVVEEVGHKEGLYQISYRGEPYPENIADVLIAVDDKELICRFDESPPYIDFYVSFFNGYVFPVSIVGQPEGSVSMVRDTSDHRSVSKPLSRPANLVRRFSDLPYAGTGHLLIRQSLDPEEVQYIQAQLRKPSEVSFGLSSVVVRVQTTDPRRKGDRFALNLPVVTLPAENGSRGATDHETSR